jgi:hypothetical protein
MFSTNCSSVTPEGMGIVSRFPELIAPGVFAKFVSKLPHPLLPDEPEPLEPELDPDELARLPEELPELLDPELPEDEPEVLDSLLPDESPLDLLDGIPSAMFFCLPVCSFVRMIKVW